MSGHNHLSVFAVEDEEHETAWLLPVRTASLGGTRLRWAHGHAQAVLVEGSGRRVTVTKGGIAGRLDRGYSAYLPADTFAPVGQLGPKPLS